MNVDEAGRHDQAGGVNHLDGGRLRQQAGRGNPSVFDGHVTAPPGSAGAVNEGAACDEDVVTGRLGAARRAEEPQARDRDEGRAARTQAVHALEV